jgi:hypothetical protein
MPSTYSNLKIQLMATGENNTTWGDVTNVNLGTALEEAIVGSADVTFASANVTLTLTDSNATQSARNVRLRCTGTTAGARDLIVPAIEKPYIVQNDCADTITVKNATGTGIAVPAGKTMWVFNNGTNVVDVTTHLTSVTLGSALVATSGGTGQSSYAVGDILFASTTTALSKLADVATGNALISGGIGVAPAYGKIGLTTHISGTLAVGNGGTGATTLTGVVKGTGTSALTAGTVALASEVSGTLPVANGGTGQTTFVNGELLIGNTTGNTLTKATLTAGSGVTITNGTGTITIAATGGTGTVTSVSFTGGIVSVATATTTPALTVAGTSGGIPYFSSGTTWASSAALAANAIVVGGGAGAAPATVTTGTGVVTALGVAVGSAGAFVTLNCALGTPSSGTLTNCTFPTLNQSTTGSAATLTTARTLTIGSTGKTFNGSANVSWTLGEIGAAASGANTDITALDQDITITATGTIAANTIGYRGIPQNAQSSTYTFALSDAGSHVYSTNSGAQTITVPTNASVAFPIGTAVTVVNNGTTAITFTTTGVTVYKAGTSTAWASGNTVAVRGLVTWLKVATDTWFVSGAGLS